MECITAVGYLRGVCLHQPPRIWTASNSSRTLRLKKANGCGTRGNPLGQHAPSRRVSSSASGTDHSPQDEFNDWYHGCLLYTSDAADDTPC
eukprot:1257411-Pyramimonas_sp.AAC.1